MIKEIKTIEKYRGLVQLQRATKNIIDNNLFMGERAKELIDKKLLWYYKEENGLVLYELNQDEAKIVLMIENPFKMVIPKFPKYKNHIMVTFRRNKFDVLILHKMLERNGFVKISDSSEMSIEPKNVMHRNMSMDSVLIKASTSKDLKAVKQIIIEILGNRINPIADEHEGFYSIYHYDNLVGGFYLNVKSRKVELEHLVIKEDFQKKGIGALVMNYIFMTHSDKVISLWVENSNVSAIRLYEKFKLKQTGKCAVQYMEEIEYEK